MMLTGIWVVVGWMTLVALTAVVLIIWAWRTGQFKDIEKAKYTMLEDKEPEPWPGREGAGTGRKESKTDDKGEGQ